MSLPSNMNGFYLTLVTIFCSMIRGDSRHLQDKYRYVLSSNKPTTSSYPQRYGRLDEDTTLFSNSLAVQALPGGGGSSYLPNAMLHQIQYIDLHGNKDLRKFKADMSMFLQIRLKRPNMPCRLLNFQGQAYAAPMDSTLGSPQPVMATRPKEPKKNRDKKNVQPLMAPKKEPKAPSAAPHRKLERLIRQKALELERYHTMEENPEKKKKKYDEYLRFRKWEIYGISFLRLDPAKFLGGYMPRKVAQVEPKGPGDGTSHSDPLFEDLFAAKMQQMRAYRDRDGHSISESVIQSRLLEFVQWKDNGKRFFTESDQNSSKADEKKVQKEVEYGEPSRYPDKHNSKLRPQLRRPPPSKKPKRRSQKNQRLSSRSLPADVNAWYTHPIATNPPRAGRSRRLAKLSQISPLHQSPSPPVSSTIAKRSPALQSSASLPTFNSNGHVPVSTFESLRKFGPNGQRNFLQPSHLLHLLQLTGCQGTSAKLGVPVPCIAQGQTASSKLPRTDRGQLASGGRIQRSEKSTQTSPRGQARNSHNWSDGGGGKELKNEQLMLPPKPETGKSPAKEKPSHKPTGNQKNIQPAILPSKETQAHPPLVHKYGRFASRNRSIFRKLSRTREK